MDVLTEDFRPQRAFAGVLLLAALCGAMVAGGAFFLCLGFRPDISQAVELVRVSSSSSWSL